MIISVSLAPSISTAQISATSEREFYGDPEPASYLAYLEFTGFQTENGVLSEFTLELKPHCPDLDPMTLVQTVVSSSARFDKLIPCCAYTLSYSAICYADLNSAQSPIVEANGNFYAGE